MNNIPNEYSDADITSINDVENIDDEHNINDAPIITGPNGEGTQTGTLNFLCAPDLLRYCTINADIRGLFAYSGATCHNHTWEPGMQDKTILSYGIYGRIPPYLLKPVSSITSIENIFTNCKRVTAYYSTTNNK